MVRLAVRCGPKAADHVLAELLVLAPGGVEEDHGPGWVEFAIYGAQGELPELDALEALAGEERIAVTSQAIPDDWADRWRDFHEPILIGDRVLVRPSWLQGDSDAQTEIVVDPGQAFGTGAHATTRMCVELLLEVSDEGGAEGSLADLGTGSGVLAIAAAKLGFAPVIALDNEGAAIEAAEVNAHANDVRIETRRANLREAGPPPARTLVANLTAPLLHEIARGFGATRRPAALLCSGLLDREVDDVAAAFANAGFTERSRRHSGEWAALRLEASA